MADEEKTGDIPVTEEEQHEPTREEPEHDEDQPSEDECDEAIAELLATITALDTRVAELERQLTQHGIEYEHVARRAEDGAGDEHGPAPEERHLYFRRIGKH